MLQQLKNCALPQKQAVYCDDWEGNAVERKPSDYLFDRAVMLMKDVIPDTYERLQRQADLEDA